MVIRQNQGGFIMSVNSISNVYGNTASAASQTNTSKQTSKTDETKAQSTTANSFSDAAAEIGRASCRERV